MRTYRSVNRRVKLKSRSLTFTRLKTYVPSPTAPRDLRAFSRISLSLSLFNPSRNPWTGGINGHRRFSRGGKADPLVRNTHNSSETRPTPLVQSGQSRRVRTHVCSSIITSGEFQISPRPPPPPTPPHAENSPQSSWRSPTSAYRPTGARALDRIRCNARVLCERHRAVIEIIADDPAPLSLSMI